MKELKSIIEHAHAHGVAASISLSVGNLSESFDLHCGHAYEHSTSTNTLYDLASLTKIVGTTLACAQAILDNKLSLDEAPFKQWPHTTLRSILAHTAGFIAHQRFYETEPLSSSDFAQNYQRTINAISVMKLKKNSPRIYSDLGFILLGDLLQQRYQRHLWQIFSRALSKAFSSHNFAWFPSCARPWSRAQKNIAPTGFRSPAQKIVAQVHDPNCFFMGGLCGHAGLFGTLNDVKHAAQFFLRARLNPKTPLQTIIKEFAIKGLGFDSPTPKGTTCYFSSQAFGHFGYTGTSLWVEPKANNRQGVYVVLLTNRVHLSEHPQGIFMLRKRIHRAVMSTITRGSQFADSA